MKRASLGYPSSKDVSVFLASDSHSQQDFTAVPGGGGGGCQGYTPVPGDSTQHKGAAPALLRAEQNKGPSHLPPPLLSPSLIAAPCKAATETLIFFSFFSFFSWLQPNEVRS